MDTDTKDKTNFFFNKRITTHIDTKDNSFYNGLIIELHETFLVINDRVLGEVPISFSEIKSIDKFKERGDGN